MIPGFPTFFNVLWLCLIVWTSHSFQIIKSNLAARQGIASDGLKSSLAKAKMSGWFNHRLGQRTGIQREAASTGVDILKSDSSGYAKPVVIAYQGESGAYSEKAARELLGPRITTRAYESFEATFKSVASKEADYAVIPIENSLGGSIHSNYDLLLRYNLHIIGEHEFRVEHCLLALPGVEKSDVKKVMSHPQALAQCDTYLRTQGYQPEPSYDTAGSAKLIKAGDLRDCAAIASDLAGSIHGLEVLECNIEDHDNNFTRFLLLSRRPVNSLMTPSINAKTSIVFILPNNPGALYKALACFSLRDIDFSKIESRPTPIQILEQIKYTNTIRRVDPKSAGTRNEFKQSESNFINSRYAFYLDFLASEFDDKAQNALMHLKEQAQFVRILGSYPTGSKLIGPIKTHLDKLANVPITTEFPSVESNPLMPKSAPLKIGIVGFGKFGQFLGKTFAKKHDVYGVGRSDMSTTARELGCEFIPLFDMASFAKVDCDVILLSCSIISFEEVLRNIPKDILRGKLVVDVLSVKVHARNTLIQYLPEDADILCTHPMFGPESGRFGWQGLPFLYDKVRINDENRCNRFLSLWEDERCKMIEMTSEQHDEYAANSQFITHLTGRILWQQNLIPTPIDTKGFQTVLNLIENTAKDSFDLFYGLYYYNEYAGIQLQKIREALSKVERQLAAKEAYLAAKAESNNDQRAQLLNEMRSLMNEIVLEQQEQRNHSPGSNSGDQNSTHN